MQNVQHAVDERRADIWSHFIDIVGVNNIVPIALAPEDGSEYATTDALAGKVGKLPSVWYAKEKKIGGFKDWTNQRATEADVQKWAADPRYGFGVVLGTPLAINPDYVAICIDCDTNDVGLQNTVERILRDALRLAPGELPMRVRQNANRRAYILFVRMPADASPLAKQILKLGKDESGKPSAVEVLAKGQQFVAFGRHPSGADIEWLNEPADSFVAEALLPAFEALRLSLSEFHKLITDISAALPLIEAVTEAATARHAATSANCPDGAVKSDRFADFLDREGFTLAIGNEGQRHFRSPNEHLYENGQGATSVTYFIEGSREYAQGAVVSKHATDAGLTLTDWQRMTGFIEDDFDFLPSGAQDTAPRVTTSRKRVNFWQWDGYTGDKYRDDVRKEYAASRITASGEPFPLRLVPPCIELKHNNKGEVSGFIAQNTSANFKWMMYKHNLKLARNLLDWGVNIFDATSDKKVTDADVLTHSRLVDLVAAERMPKDIIKDHRDAAAHAASFHPVAELLHDGKWDGMNRVQAVFDCVPVEADQEAMRNKLLTGICLAAIAALDDGKVSVKYAPVLFSEANDYFKTAFIRRLFDICPGAFKEGVSVDPRSKDSVRKAVFSLGTELGELDSMTKTESGLLKAWLPLDEDEWRTEHKAFYDRKPRQTVFIGTVNKATFIADETLSSRFPTISLTAPINIDRVNEILGWKLVAGAPVLIAPELLKQFWLEIRAMRAAGATHVLDLDTLVEMKKSNEKHIEKGSYYQVILEALEGSDTLNPFERDLAAGDWFNISDVSTLLHISADKGLYVGRALTRLAKEGYLEKKASKHGMKYRVIKTVDQE